MQTSDFVTKQKKYHTSRKKIVSMINNLSSDLYDKEYSYYCDNANIVINNKEYKISSLYIEYGYINDEKKIYLIDFHRPKIDIVTNNQVDYNYQRKKVMLLKYSNVFYDYYIKKDKSLLEYIKMFDGSINYNVPETYFYNPKLKEKSGTIVKKGGITMGRINEELAKQKGLIIEGDTTNYDELVKVYKYLLEYYISTKIDLSKYEDMIKNSGLYIGVNDKYKSLNEYLKLDYIFLITNLFVEKLSEEDINILKGFDKNNITDEMINVIRRTYKDVIYDNYFKGEYQNIKYNVCYGPMVPFNFVDNDAIAFKIYYGKNLMELDGDAFIELHEKQLAFFDELIKKFKDEVKEKLDINCGVLLEKDIY